MRIAVQMDPPSGLKPLTDTTFMLIAEACARDHQVYWYEPQGLSWAMGDLRAPLTPITVHYDRSPIFTLGDTTTESLRAMDVVLMRQDPPFHMAYVTATHLLEQIMPDVAVWNHPGSVRNAPEKLSILGFAPYMPPTLISRDPSEIHAFAQAHGTVVAKPLYGFGGRSVYKLAKDDSNIDTLIEQWSELSPEPLMWQAFLPQVTSEDKRVLFIDGEVASVFGRVPEEGSIRANMRVGGTPQATELSPRQQEICTALTPFLKQQGLMLAGVDLIGDYLTEINVTSPTGLRAAEKLYGLNLAATFWDAVEAQRA